MKMQSFVCYCNVPWTGSSCEIKICKYRLLFIFDRLYLLSVMQIRGEAFERRCNISNTKGSVSSGYPNTDNRVENTTRSGAFLTKFEVFG